MGGFDGSACLLIEGRLRRILEAEATGDGLHGERAEEGRRGGGGVVVGKGKRWMMGVKGEIRSFRRCACQVPNIDLAIYGQGLVKRSVSSSGQRLEMPFLMCPFCSGSLRSMYDIARWSLV